MVIHSCSIEYIGSIKTKSTSHRLVYDQTPFGRSEVKFPPESGTSPKFNPQFLGPLGHFTKISTKNQSKAFQVILFTGRNLDKFVSLYLFGEKGSTNI